MCEPSLIIYQLLLV